MARSKQASGSPPKAPKAPSATLEPPGTPETAGTQVGDPEAQARQICLRLLTIAPRTRAQLAQALHRRGVPGRGRRDRADRFADVGLIDDAAFARAWVESRHYSRGLSRRSLSAELRRQGVAERGDPRGGRHPRSRAGSRHRPAPGGAEDGGHPRPAARGPRPPGGRHAGQEGLSAGPGLPADQGSPGARRAAEAEATRPGRLRPVRWTRRPRRVTPATSATPVHDSWPGTAKYGPVRATIMPSPRSGPKQAPSRSRSKPPPARTPSR